MNQYQRVHLGWSYPLTPRTLVPTIVSGVDAGLSTGLVKIGAKDTQLGKMEQMPRIVGLRITSPHGGQGA